MNMFQKIAAYFGREYILLDMAVGLRVCHSYKLGECVYSNPYLSESRTELLPGGGVVGQSYIFGWKPITKKSLKLYYK